MYKSKAYKLGSIEELDRIRKEARSLPRTLSFKAKKELSAGVQAINKALNALEAAERDQLKVLNEFADNVRRIGAKPQDFNEYKAAQSAYEAMRKEAAEFYELASKVRTFIARL